jgi:hypothetical protein
VDDAVGCPGIRRREHLQEMAGYRVVPVLGEATRAPEISAAASQERERALAALPRIERGHAAGTPAPRNESGSRRGRCGHYPDSGSRRLARYPVRPSHWHHSFPSRLPIRVTLAPPVSSAHWHAE